MDNSQKRTSAVLSFLPFIAILVYLVYFLVSNSPEIKNRSLQDSIAVDTQMSHHYSTFLIMAIIFGLTVMVDWFYFFMHLARIKTMNSNTKMVWMIFMMVFNFIAFPIYWYRELRTEPANVPMHDDVK